MHTVSTVIDVGVAVVLIPSDHGRRELRRSNVGPPTEVEDGWQRIIVKILVDDASDGRVRGSGGRRGDVINVSRRRRRIC